MVMMMVIMMINDDSNNDDDDIYSDIIEICNDYDSSDE